MDGVSEPSNGPVVGQVVRLRSGGPGMTVAHIRSDGFVEVEWFDGLAVSRDAFRVECLTPGGTLVVAPDEPKYFGITPGEAFDWRA